MNGTDDRTPDADLESRLEEAAALADDGRWREAFDILREQEEEHPDDATVLCMLGVSARALGAEGRAYDYFRRSLAAGPSDPVLLITAGSGLADFDDPEAESAFRLAALTAPDLALARMRYGSYLAREGIFDTALPELKAARALEPEDASVRFELAVAYLLAGRTEQGVEELEETLVRDPEHHHARLLYGLALLEADQWEEAAAELHRLSTERADDPEAQLLAALACATQGWTDEAWNALARAEATGVADPHLLREVEATLEAGPLEVRELLSDHLAPVVYRERLLQRS